MKSNHHLISLPNVLHTLTATSLVWTPTCKGLDYGTSSLSDLLSSTFLPLSIPVKVPFLPHKSDRVTLLRSLRGFSYDSEPTQMTQSQPKSQPAPTVHTGACLPLTTELGNGALHSQCSFPRLPAKVLHFLKRKLKSLFSGRSSQAAKCFILTPYIASSHCSAALFPLSTY